jgi:hypothetical protein
MGKQFLKKTHTKKTPICAPAPMNATLFIRPCPGQAMGYGRPEAERALVASGGDVNAAAAWLLG